MLYSCFWFRFYIVVVIVLGTSFFFVVIIVINHIVAVAFVVVRVLQGNTGFISRSSQMLTCNMSTLLLFVNA